MKRITLACLLLLGLLVVTAAAAASYRTVAIKQAGLTLQVPSPWKAVTVERTVYAARDESERGGFQSNVNVVVVPLRRVVPLKEYRLLLLAELKKAGGIGITAAIVHLRAGDAVRAAYKLRGRGTILAGTQVCFSRGLKSIVITYTRPNKNRKVTSIFAHSIASIRFR